MTLRRIALVGQPNSGKSTLFNALVGFRAVASNFPGTTVEVIRGRTTVGGQLAELVDLPGTYSLCSSDPAEQQTRDFLLSGAVQAVVHVVDASVLARSLELTLELAELGLPMVLCLNMADEAEHKGLRVDVEELAERLGIPVVATVARRGEGLRELLAAIPQARPARLPRYAADLERALVQVASVLERNGQAQGLPLRHAASQALAGTLPLPPAVQAELEPIREELKRQRGEDPALVLADERHAQALRLFEETTRVSPARITWRERLDDVLMHPWLGYPVLLAVFLALFWSVYRMGTALEGLLVPRLEVVSELVEPMVGGGVGGAVLLGALNGLWAGLAIVLPYLLPFLVLMALLEDVGYLPRVGFLLDGLMHKVGLHGKSVIPFLLGYGCSVPAVLATRILEHERDRLLTAGLAVLIPCAARTVILMGLVGRYIGPFAALGLYLFNVGVVAAASFVLTRLLPGWGPGLIWEIPPYRWPQPRAVAGKVWLRLKGFVLVAWPVLVAGSALLGLGQALGWDRAFNQALRLFTWPLGLPAETGVPLVFSVLRKELGLVLLGQALGSEDFSQVLTQGQMLVFTMFILFFVPCLATVGTLGREIGWKRTGLVVGGTLLLALGLGLLTRAVVNWL